MGIGRGKIVGSVGYLLRVFLFERFECFDSLSVIALLLIVGERFEKFTRKFGTFGAIVYSFVDAALCKLACSPEHRTFRLMTGRAVSLFSVLTL